MSRFAEKYGPWALVTGASSGIGEEFARQIASKGLNLVLVARREDRMQQLAAELESAYGIQTRVLKLDLTEADFLDKLEVIIRNLEIRLLINNAGMSVMGSFYKRDPKHHLKMLQLNAQAPMILAHHFAKKMVEAGRGGIIFTASVSSFFSIPYVGHYAATKAYILALAESMNFELRKKGVQVQALCPGLTRTEMAEGINSSMMMEVGPVVKASLDALPRNRASVIPGFVNKFMAVFLQRLLPRKTMTQLAAKFMG